VARNKTLLTKLILGVLCIYLLGCQTVQPEGTATPLPSTSTATLTPVPTASATSTATATLRAVTTTPEGVSAEANSRTRRAEMRATSQAELQANSTPAPAPEEATEVRPTVTAAPEASETAVVELAPQERAPMIPLIDMGTATYYGLEGGLYPGGTNEMPAEHSEEGLRRAMAIQPLNTDGLPDPAGKYIMLSVGMSNTAMEFCAALGIPQDYNTRQCFPYSFMARSAADPNVNHSTLVILSGARGGQVADQWLSPEAENFDRIRDELLTTRGLSEQQVQVIWLKVVNRPDGRPPLPAEGASAYGLTASLADIVRALKARYPNLQQVFLSSRIYAGYADERGEQRNPEPYAYESGFAVKWLIEAQIGQMQTGEIDPIAGDLDYNSVAPWLAWGPYLWADGLNPRSDGLVWPQSDFTGDGVHPTVSGRTKVATMLLDFFSSSPHSRCWYLAASCG
jgi:hypothetical protein